MIAIASHSDSPCQSVDRLLPPAVPHSRDRRLLRDLEAFLRQHIVGDAAGVDRQAVVVQHAAQLRDALGDSSRRISCSELRVAVLLDDVDALVRVDERRPDRR